MRVLSVQAGNSNPSILRVRCSPWCAGNTISRLGGGCYLRSSSWHPGSCSLAFSCDRYGISAIRPASVQECHERSDNEFASTSLSDASVPLEGDVSRQFCIGWNGRGLRIHPSRESV